MSTECRAYEDYKTVFAAGEDGRPHWVARKTCNYLTEAIDVIASSYTFKILRCTEESCIAKNA